VQKVKLAAIEAEWETHPAPAGFTLFGLPNLQEQRTDYAVKIPYALGLIATRSLDEEVKGIKQLVAEHELAPTLAIGIRDRLTRWGLIRLSQERDRVAGMISDYDIRCSGPHQVVGTLSGGNQQKALLARWLEREPEVLVLDEPTRGIDVGAKAEIHSVVDRLAAAGHGVLLISSDLPEVVGMSDRVLVMSRGRLVAELSGESQTEREVLQAAAGLVPGGEAS